MPVLFLKILILMMKKRFRLLQGHVLQIKVLSSIYIDILGQICLCASRIYVHESIYERFLNMLKENALKITVGDPFDPNSKMGPLISMQHLEKVLSYINIAESEGGKVVTGGNRVSDGVNPDGCFIAPTIITGIHPINCRIQQEEVFGPVVTVTSFSTEEQVIKWANGTKYGLSACVWTQNIKQAHRVAKRLQSGTVWVVSDNDLKLELLDDSGLKYAFWRA